MVNTPIFYLASFYVHGTTDMLLLPFLVLYNKIECLCECQKHLFCQNIFICCGSVAYLFNTQECANIKILKTDEFYLNFNDV